MELDPDIAALVGDDAEPVKRGPGRPMKPENVERVERHRRAAEVLESLVAARKQDREPEYNSLNIADVAHGVTVGWLAQVFHMDVTTVRKRLKDCAPIAHRKAGHVYDLKIAAQYLVKPVFDVDAYMRTMKVSELPTHLQDAYWSAMTKKQKWEEQAGHLWRTEAVMEVLGETFQAIKFAIQLWPDMVERSSGLTADQRKMLVQMADGLQTDIHARLIEMPNNKATLPVAAEHADPDSVPMGEANDDDYSHLV